MIVNTAYIYMGSGGTPVNPNLWQDGVANYPVTLTDAEISSGGLTLKRNGAATFSELQLTGFNNLTISLTPNSNTQMFGAVVKIKFINSAGELLGTETADFGRPSGESPVNKTVNIPSSAKIQSAKISITNNSNHPSSRNSITLPSALLS